MMKRALTCEEVRIEGENLLLLPEKAIFWPDRQALILSDIHLGKAGHFRKNGIAIPSNTHFADLEKIEKLINTYQAKRIYFLGDLFHSELNREWEIFNIWIKRFSDRVFFLVKGNHDILPSQLYGVANLVVEDRLEAGPFLFTHEKEESDQLYNISGHIHPCVRLKGLARQNLRLPCFYFGPKYGFLPAFGVFTGFHTIKVYEKDRIYAVADDQIISLST